MIGAAVSKFLAVPISRIKGLRDASMVALASVAQTLFEMCKSTLAEDVKKIKNEFVKRVKARTQLEIAEARKRVAEAADAANKVTVRSHEEELRRLERERLQIENATKKVELSQAEAQASEAHSKAVAAKLKNIQSIKEMFEEARQKRGEEAESELIEALRQLNTEGGKIYFDSDNLKHLLKSGKESKS
jgi:flagellar biosynthesis GTPase FlhF